KETEVGETISTASDTSCGAKPVSALGCLGCGDQDVGNHRMTPADSDFDPLRDSRLGRAQLVEPRAEQSNCGLMEARRKGPEDEGSVDDLPAYAVFWQVIEVLDGPVARVGHGNLKRDRHGSPHDLLVISNAADGSGTGRFSGHQENRKRRAGTSGR
ncbi:MAG TPA: hypothetical protein VHA75_12685, partial [Rugosimonospora sp.]|nr:hypothetical protein [Rugosimonospora sp.]